MKRETIEPSLPVLGVEKGSSLAREWWTASREGGHREKDGLPLPEKVTGGASNDEGC